MTSDHLESGLLRALRERHGVDIVDAIRPTVDGKVDLSIHPAAFYEMTPAQHRQLHALVDQTNDDLFLERCAEARRLTEDEQARRRRIRIERGHEPPEKPAQLNAVMQTISGLMFQHGIRLRVAPYFTAQSASLKSRRVTLWWPIRTEESAAGAWHELGHLLGVAPGEGRYVQVGVSPLFVNVRAEIEAWRWARRSARDYFPGLWSPAMERALVRGLRSYWSGATTLERREIDALIGNSGGADQAMPARDVGAAP